jgi:hypothetical protein
MSQKSILKLFFVCFAAVYHASGTAPAVTADFTIAISPTGGVTRQLDGRYARSSNGKIREETATFVIITDPEAQTTAILNPATKEATIIKLNGASTAGRRSEAASPSVNPLAEFESTVVDGHPVVKKRTAAASDGSTREIWMTTDSSIPILAKTSSPTKSTTKTFRNIVLKEPDAALFTIPKDYSITNTSDNGSCPLPECSVPPPSSASAHPQ